MADETYTWTLTASQKHGNLYLKWHTTAPFRAHDGTIVVYSGDEFPTDTTTQWKWNSGDNTATECNTGLTWGSDWYCAWIGRDVKNTYKYVVQLITTGRSNPDSKTAE